MALDSGFKGLNDVRNAWKVNRSVLVSSASTLTQSPLGKNGPPKALFLSLRLYLSVTHITSCMRVEALVQNEHHSHHPPEADEVGVGCHQARRMLVTTIIMTFIS